MIEEKAMIKDFLRKYALEYHNKNFIMSDPVQFPHRYSDKRDIEISGFLTSFISFGARPQILKFSDKLDTIMSHKPYEYVISGRWKEDFYGSDSFYRTISKDKMREMFAMLHDVYTNNDDMEQALLKLEGSLMERMCKMMGVSLKSPQKKINMFLRWMVRRDSEVDFGIWNSFSPAELIIPLDVHVSNVSFSLGLTKSKAYSLSNAKLITKELNEIFPGDPCMGDFALFGYGVNNKE